MGGPDASDRGHAAGKDRSLTSGRPRCRGPAYGPRVASLARTMRPRLGGVDPRAPIPYLPFPVELAKDAAPAEVGVSHQPIIVSTRTCRSSGGHLVYQDDP